MAFGAAFLRLFERGMVEVKKCIDALLEWTGISRYIFRNFVKVALIACREDIELFPSHISKLEG